MARKILLMVFLFSALSCCKVDPPEVMDDPLPIGTWNIVAVDSGFHSGYSPTSNFRFIGSMGLTGQITFNNNGRGSLIGDASLISCTFNDFSWVYYDSLACLYLVFRDQLSKGILKKMNQDSIVFDFQDWCREGDRYTGGAVYYRITAIKQSLKIAC